MKAEQVVRTAIPVVFLAAILSQSALAQERTPRLEFSGGYSFFKDFASDQSSKGWVGSAGYNFNRFVGVHGEIGANYGSVDAMGSNVKLRITSLMGGPRFSYRKITRITPFAHIFLGRTDRGGEYYGSDQTDLAWQIGGGADSWLNSKIAIRAGGDFRHSFSYLTPSNGFRFQFGVVVGVPGWR